MGHSAGWYAYMEGQYQKEKRQREAAERQRAYEERKAYAIAKYGDYGKCPECGGYLRKRKGKYGEFLGCSNYPNCKHNEKL